MGYKQKSPIPIIEGGTNAITMTNTNGISYYDGTRLVTTTVGSSGEVLTSNGAGVAPTFQAGGGGGITQIDGDSGSATGATITFTGSTSGAVFTAAASTVTQSFDFLSLPATTSTDGQILINAVPYFQATGTRSVFIANAGNLTNTGSDNIAMGNMALASLTSGATNIAIGASALTSNDDSTDNIAIGNTAMVSLNGGGGSNIAIGSLSGQSLTSGNSNTAVGTGAMQGGGGTRNGCVAIGASALGGGSATGSNNIGIGLAAGVGIGSGSENIGIGSGALTGGFSPSGGNNIGIGQGAIQSFIAGSTNIGIGVVAGGNILDGTDNICIGGNSGININNGDSNIYIGTASGTSDDGIQNICIGASLGASISGDNNIAIGGIAGASPAGGFITIGDTGTHTVAYIAGIFGSTVGATGIPVVIDTDNQLGTVVSSARYKENIQDMDSYSSDIYKLRPVLFNYKKDEAKHQQVGLIAEEVEEVSPHLVVYNKEALPETVRYLDLIPMLLNEIQKLKKEVNGLKGK